MATRLKEVIKDGEAGRSRLGDGLVLRRPARLAVRLGLLGRRGPARANDGGRGALALLRRRSRFRLLFAGFTISALGDPLTKVALLVSAYGIRHDALDVGLVYVLEAVVAIGTGAALGGLIDRWDRRRLVVAGDWLRAVLLLTAPLTLRLGPVALIALIAATAGVNALVQPARMAGMSTVVEGDELQPANALLASASNLGNLAGYPLAAWSLVVLGGTAGLFIADGLTFAAAALLTSAAGQLGGATVRRRALGGIGAALSFQPARGRLLLAAAAALFIAASLPALFALAYQLNPAAGASTYGLLELVLGAGALAGALAMTRVACGRFAAPAGLAVMGALSLGLAGSPWPLLSGLCLFVASMANPVYTVANNTSILASANETNRGVLMSARYTLTSAAAVVGAGGAGVILSAFGARAGYWVIGCGLLGCAGLAVLTEAE